jgi:hypothetical protein
MIKQIIAYIAVFLLTLYCFFLYDDEILAAMLMGEIIYFAVSMIWLRGVRKQIDVKIESIIPIAEKNQEIPIHVVISNQSKLVNVPVKVYVKVENLFTGERQRLKNGGVLKSNRCGNLEISIEKCLIYDMFGILKAFWKGKEKHYVGILPECHLIPVEISRRTREFLADADEYSDRESGDDPSEIYQVREYREKDSLHDIHWKLSAKAEELLVKEYGRPLGSVVLIWLDLFVGKGQKRTVSDSVLEFTASLSRTLLEEKCVHTVSWYEVENQTIQKKRISKEEHIYELLNRLLYTKVHQEQIADIYEDAFRGMEFSTVVEVYADGKVIVNKEEKMKLPSEEKVNWDKMYFVL